MKFLAFLVVFVTVIHASKISVYDCLDMINDGHQVLICDHHSDGYYLCQTYEDNFIQQDPLENFNKVVQDIHFDG